MGKVEEKQAGRKTKGKLNEIEANRMEKAENTGKPREKALTDSNQPDNAGGRALLRAAATFGGNNLRVY